MASAYGLGVFNDNFFKQAACLLALAADRKELPGLAAALFALPFILFAAPAGWMADRFAKTRVARWSKGLEVAAMAAGGLGLAFMHWPLVLAMVLLMGIQSAFFSPALNGSIPECFAPGRVVAVNGMMKAVTTVMMLAGLAAAGLALSLGGAGPGGIPAGRAVAAAAALAVAAGGWLASLRLPAGRPPARPGAAFPWDGPRGTWRVLRRERAGDPLLWRAIRVSAWVWAAAAAQTLLVNQLAAEAFGLGPLGTTGLVMAELAGVAAGGWAAGRLSGRGGVAGTLARLPAGAVLAAAGATVAAASPALGAEAAARGGPGGLAWAAAGLWTLGLGGGSMLVPLDSFVQARPPPGSRGEVWALSNAVSFAGILAAGGGLAALCDPGLAAMEAATGLRGVALAFLGLGAASLRRPLAPPGGKPLQSGGPDGR